MEIRFGDNEEKEEEENARTLSFWQAESFIASVHPLIPSQAQSIKFVLCTHCTHILNSYI